MAVSDYEKMTPLERRAYESYKTAKRKLIIQVVMLLAQVSVILFVVVPGLTCLGWHLWSADTDCAEQCAPIPHAFVDGACGCVEVLDAN